MGREAHSYLQKRDSRLPRWMTGVRFSQCEFRMPGHERARDADRQFEQGARPDSEPRPDSLLSFKMAYGAVLVPAEPINGQLWTTPRAAGGSLLTISAWTGVSNLLLTGAGVE